MPAWNSVTAVVVRIMALVDGLSERALKPRRNLDIDRTVTVKRFESHSE